jgi:hypothetical protein
MEKRQNATDARLDALTRHGRNGKNGHNGPRRPAA